MNEELLKKLHSLAQLDRDAVAVYNDALSRVTDEDVKTHFTEFRDEHAHHVTELSAAITRLGDSAPEFKIDAMGMVAEWVVSFRSMMGEKGPLHAMHSAETYHNSRYKDAAGWTVDDADLRSELQAFYAEEQRHLSYIDARLAVKA
jgi:rubrerythrin